MVATILAAGHGLGSGGAGWPFGIQEGLLLGIAVAAYLSTPHAYRAANAFAFAPIIEVAVLFAGIFVTMAPALLLLNAHAAEFGLERALAVLLGVGPALELPRQRAHLSDLRRHRRAA